MTETPSPVAIPHPDPDVTTADDTQVTYYEGSPKLRGELGMLAMWSLIGLILLAVPILAHLGLQNGVPWWFIAGGVVIGLICWVLPGILVRRERYRITNYRIDIERGLLFKNFDTIELWHVEDVSLRQSPIDRIFNVGTITVVSHDPTSPRLQLDSIANPRQLLETLKTRIISVKRQRGVIKVDGGV
ncbi:MAG: PH domain-containing protein [Tepidisphaeraceae bacterium]